MTRLKLLLFLYTLLIYSSAIAQIDRHALLQRNNPVVTRIDSLESLTVGNGDFAFTVDATGLQTFPEVYSEGVPLGTMSNWGWHYADNNLKHKFSDVLEKYDFNHGHSELYAGQSNKGAANYFRENPHRLHLGNVGFYGLRAENIKDIHQELHLEEGEIISTFTLNGQKVEVKTICDPHSSRVAVKINAESQLLLPLVIRMPYPSMKHSDNACDWSKGADYHKTILVEQGDNCVQLTHSFPQVNRPTEFDTDTVFDASYHLGICADSKISVERLDANTLVITPSKSDVEYIFDWEKDINTKSIFSPYKDIRTSAVSTWHDFWYNGAAVDFSHCTNPQAKELERRVVLSQYLLAVNCCGDVPPQETGLTYNSWYGKFHLEMIWWHQAWFALWGHPEKLHRTLRWYLNPEVHQTARWIAERQGFKGVRWMKMTDPSGLEAPSKVGSFLIWNEPHLIHLAELLRRCEGDSIMNEFGDVVNETAEFMTDFTTYDKKNKRYILKGYIPAQETLKASEVVNSPFELSQWHLCLKIANEWLNYEMKNGRNDKDLKALSSKCKTIVNHLSSLASTAEVTGSQPKTTTQPLYLAAETAKETYFDSRFTQDHMSVLGALGIYPEWYGINKKTMLNTLLWVQNNWNWDKTWGWDHPMTAMCAVRLHRPDLAIQSLLAPHRTNTYLLNGHNYQDSRLRIYLPGNGALLQCVALMCAGWDGCNEVNPGFPKDGTWDVRWEGFESARAL